MALPEKRNELNRIDEQMAFHRVDERQQAGRQMNESKSEEHRDHGHQFRRDVHPERYPRESLSRLEEGILEDDELRHTHDRLAYAGPDMESRVDDSRNLSRTLIVLGVFLLVFAWVLLLWVGWDVRSGSVFFSSMCAVAIALGLGLVAWGYVERQRVLRLRAPLARPIEEHIEQSRRRAQA